MLSLGILREVPNECDCQVNERHNAYVISQLFTKNECFFGSVTHFKTISLFLDMNVLYRNVLFKKKKLHFAALIQINFSQHVLFNKKTEKHFYSCYIILLTNSKQGSQRNILFFDTISLFIVFEIYFKDNFVIITFGKQYEFCLFNSFKK